MNTSIVVGAPVTNRAWVLPAWWEALAAQSVRPDAIVLLWSSWLPDGRVDDTRVAIERLAREHGIPTHLISNHCRPHHRHDNERFHTLARLRNMLKSYVGMTLDPDLYLSLDTDVILDNPGTIGRLADHCGLFEVASPMLWLHPSGQESWAYNAGWLTDRGVEPFGQRRWHRVPDFPAGQGVVEHQVPMAAVMMDRLTRESCHYAWHESGEDIGFAQSLEQAEAVCVIDTDLIARHVWDETALGVPA